MINVDSRGALYPNARNWTKNAYDFLSPIISGLTYDGTNNKLDFWGKFTWSLTASNWPTGTVTANGHSMSDGGAPGEMESNRTYRFAVVKTDDFFHFSMTRDMGGNATICWFRDEDGKEYVGWSRANRSWEPARELYDGNLGMRDIETLGTVFYFKDLLNFTMPEGKIATIDKQIMTNGGVPQKFSKELMGCSNVGYRKTITMNNKNYFAIDTNTLYCLDEEEPS